jgi:HJR/Mrr/RecB family endonuclease
MHEQALLALGKPQPVMQFINMLSKKIFAGCMDVIISNNVLFVDVSADGNNMPIVELMVNEDGGKTAKILDAHERNLRYAASIIRKALAWLALSVESITTLKQVVLSVHAQDTKCILSIKADATAAKKMLNVNNKNYRFGLNNLNRFDSRFAVEEGTGELLRVEAWSKPTIMSATRIENTPQLSSVSPQRFEQIIRDLIDKMGLEVVLTKQTRDGGIDIDAYDMRPIVGGRVIVQCKRYSNPVGVVAVRELAGVMHQEKA